MRKKILITLFIVILLFQAIIPIKASAVTEKYEIISVPAQINRQTTEYEESVENEMTGLDLVAGILIEPTVEFFTFVLDGIMSVLSGVMTQQDIKFVMVKKEEIEEVNNLPNLSKVGTDFTITEEEMEGYKTASGSLEKLEYPRFTYSPEEIFSGNLDLLDINFIEDSNEDTNWQKIRTVVAQWYQILRMVAIIGLLSVLIYVGIKIILSSNTKDKAKYKEMIANWFIAVMLAFFMQYIMAFILAVMEAFVGLLNEIAGAIQVNAGATISFKTNLMGLARFQMQQQHFSAKIGHLVIYTALVVFTFKFTFVYLKRVLRMAFLTVIAPIVAITYPIDKMEGEAKGFQMWLKEYIYNALLQPMHYILYYILVSSSLSLSARNPVYGIAALMFISEAEKLLKRIFGFDKARAGTVGGISGAFATGVVTSSLIKYVKDPTHPFAIGKGNSKSGGTSKGNNLANGNYSNDENIKFLDDTKDEDFLIKLLQGETNITDDTLNVQPNTPLNTSDGTNPSENPIITDFEKFFSRYRKTIPVSINDSGEFYLDGDGSYTIEDVLKMLADYKKPGPNSTIIPGFEKLSYDELRNLLLSKVDSNESEFTQNNILPQYIDGDRRSSRELMEEIINLNNPETHTLNSSERSRQSEELLNTLKNRMAQNQYIQDNGGVLALKQKEESRIETLRNTSQQQDDVNISGSGNPILPNGYQQYGQRTVQQPGQRPVQQAGQRLLQQLGQQSAQQTGQQHPVQQPQQQQVPQVQPQEPQEQNPKDPNTWEKFKENRVVKGISRVGEKTGKTIIKPVWDVEKGLDARYNGKRLAKKIVTGVAGATVGVAAAAVQAGISITDGKYNPLEGAATVAAGMTGVSHLAKNAENKIEENRKDKQTLERYSEQWFNRDDIISSYNIEYPGEGKAMRRRAVNNYVSRGITDFNDQKQAMKFADLLKKERGLHEEEADKIAVATLQYRQNLTRNNNYMILFDEKKRKKYIDVRTEAYSGAASKDSIRRLHDDLIENVRDFDRANS